MELVLQSGGYGGTIPSSLRQVALQLAVSSGNASVLQLVKECYLSTSDRACLTALASCPPSDECLKLTLDPNFPREDSGRLLYDIASQGGGRFSLVWSWLIDKGGMDSLLKQWSPAEGGDHSLAASGVTYSLSRYLSMMTDLLMDATLLAKIESFASTYASVLDPDFLVAARQSFDFNRAWVGRGKSDCEWLDPSLKPDD